MKIIFFKKRIHHLSRIDIMICENETPTKQTANFVACYSLVIIAFLACYSLVIIAFVNLERWLAKSLVDATRSHHGKFPAALL